jgi:hypothetical protein
MPKEYRQMMPKKEKKKMEKEMKGCCDIAEPEYWPQSIRFNDNQLPEIKDWKVGESYEVSIIVKQRSLNENKKGFNADFDVVAVKPLGDKLTKEQRKIMDFMSDEYKDEE